MSVNKVISDIFYNKEMPDANPDFPVSSEVRPYAEKMVAWLEENGVEDVPTVRELLRDYFTRWDDAQ